MTICTEPEILMVVKIVRLVANAARIAIPIVLIIFTLISYMNAASDGNLASANKKLVKRAIFAVIALLLPTILKVLFVLAIPDVDVDECLNNANDATISSLRPAYADKMIETLSNDFSKSNYENALSAVNKIDDDSVRQQKLSQLTEYENYLELEERIAAQKRVFNETEFKQLYSEVMSVSNESAKEYLHTAINEVYPDLLMVDAGEYSGSGSGFSYNVYIPELATVNMPLVIYLHGSGGIPQTFVDAVKDIYGEYFPMIIIGPKLQTDSWNGAAVQESLASTIQSVCSQYSCNEEKIATMGHSLGAMGVWGLVNNNPDLFSRAFPISGDLSIDSSNFTNTKIAAVCGTGDTSDLYKSMKSMVSSINSSGGDAKMIVLNGAHDEALYFSLTKDNIDWLIE